MQYGYFINIICINSGGVAKDFAGFESKYADHNIGLVTLLWYTLCNTSTDIDNKSLN